MRKKLHLACTVLLLAPQTSLARHSPKQISLCTLVADRKSIKNVKIRAMFDTDLFEHSAFYDPYCQWLPVDLFEKSPNTANARIFSRSVQGHIDDLSMRRFQLDVTGDFKWRDNARPMFFVVQYLHYHRVK